MPVWGCVTAPQDSVDVQSVAGARAISRDHPSALRAQRTRHQSEDIVNTRARLSSRGATNALLAIICALLGLQLVSARAEVLLPRRLMAEGARRAGRSADAPQPVYLVSGPAGGKLDMLPVSVVYLDKNGALENGVGPDGSVRVRVIP